MSQVHSAVPAPPTRGRSADSYAASGTASRAEHEADRYAAHATTGRAAKWSFSQVPVHGEAPGRDLLARIGGPGQRVDDATAQQLGAGLDLGDVRLHTGADAAALAQEAGADAITVGKDIAFAADRYDTRTQRGRHLLAHELAHAAQHPSGAPLQVHHKNAGESTRSPAQADYEMFVDEAVAYLTTATDYYRVLAQTAKLQQTAPTSPSAAAPTKEEPAAPTKDEKQGGAAAKDGQQGTALDQGLSADRLPSALEKLRETYESSQQILEQQLNGDAGRTAKLRRAYVNAAAAARAAAVGVARANIIIIAAPKDKRDRFIANATSYAKLYYGSPRGGESMSMITDVDSVEALFDAIEHADPARMVGRIDIFCHGTIEPVHELKLGTVWHRVGDFESVAAARAGASGTLATQSRFDGSSVIELHACRLGAPISDVGKSAETPTTGSDFLGGFGKAVGGEQGQTVTGYQQRWVPRVFQLGNIHHTKQLNAKQRQTFDNVAVKTYDAAMAGGAEVQNLLTDAEAKSGVVTRDRKIAIMERLYNEGGGWLIGHQYSTKTPQSTDPVKDVKGARDTFSNEKDWQSHVLSIKVPSAGGTP